MQGSSLVYSNARAKSLENTLLNSEKITRMVFAESLEEGVRILFESSYGGGVQIADFNQYETLLSEEFARIAAFLREVMPDDSGMECFLGELDFHNAKVFAKAKYLRVQDTAAYQLPDGLIKAEALRQWILEENYVQMPEQMQKAMREIDLRFASGERSGRLVDTLLERAQGFWFEANLSSQKHKIIREYFTILTDTKNVATLFRCKRQALDQKFFAEQFLPGGSIHERELNALFEQSPEAVAEALKYKTIGPLLPYALEDYKQRGGALVRFETERDNMLLKLFENGRNDIFSVAPIAGLYVAKMQEIKTVRMILVGLKNNLDKTVLKERLRNTYA